MSKRRPVNLNIATLRFPVTAWVSIAHRLSGIGLFLLIPALLWILQESLASEERWLMLKESLHHPIVIWLMWAFILAILYHAVAGMRHLGLDLGIGETKRGGRIGAWMVIALTLIFSGIIGYRLW